MKTSEQVILSIVLIFSTVASRAQIQQAWVARYNNGILNGTNQAVKMALDAAGNIYVTGSSQNSNQQIGYVTMKYAANGSPLWTTRFDATNYPAARPATLVLDSNDDSVVTGSAVTVKYDPNGNQLWTAPYAGTAMAMDSSGDAYVTGFGTNFNTVKLSPAGSNLWLTTAQDVGPTVGQGIVADNYGDAYVSGSDLYNYSSDGPNTVENTTLLTIKYASNGSQIWVTRYGSGSDIAAGVQVAGMALDGASNLYQTFNGTPGSYGEYNICEYDRNGNQLWSAFPNNNGHSLATGLALDSATNVLVTGKAGNFYPDFFYATFKVNPNANGAILSTNYYPLPPAGVSVATSIAVDSANNYCVTGYSPGANSKSDIVTIKYGPNGNQIWLQRYSSPGGGNAAGNAIAVDNNGNVYVCGYDTTAAGGTEMVTIKYSPLVLQIQTNGAALLKAQGFPGENFNIEASADLQTWLDIGSAITDTNGLMQYSDTNASNFSARFYSTTPQ